MTPSDAPVEPIFLVRPTCEVVCGLYRRHLRLQYSSLTRLAETLDEDLLLAFAGTFAILLLGISLHRYHVEAVGFGAGIPSPSREFDSRTDLVDLEAAFEVGTSVRFLSKIESLQAADAYTLEQGHDEAQYILLSFVEPFHSKHESMLLLNAPHCVLG